MKKTIILLSLLFLSFTAKYGDFCEGYKFGYKKGYCYQEYGCLPPLTPLCPLRNYNEQDTFQDGYNRGFIDGINNKN